MLVQAGYILLPSVVFFYTQTILDFLQLTIHCTYSTYIRLSVIIWVSSFGFFVTPRLKLRTAWGPSVIFPKTINLVNNEKQTTVWKLLCFVLIFEYYKLFDLWLKIELKSGSATHVIFGSEIDVASFRVKHHRFEFAHIETKVCTWHQLTSSDRLPKNQVFSPIVNKRIDEDKMIAQIVCRVYRWNRECIRFWKPILRGWSHRTKIRFEIWTSPRSLALYRMQHHKIESILGQMWRFFGSPCWSLSSSTHFIRLLPSVKMCSVKLTKKTSSR